VEKNVEVEKAVPLYITTEKPVIVEVKVPYVETVPQMISCEIEKFVPFRE
jgi:thiamine pyrophosphate-dependent acetolactate synthase large subunit-like protein